VAEDRLKITVICDNTGGDGDLTSSWGFACLIQGLESTILFDTGDEGPTFMGNLTRLGVAPESIDAVVLSHDHWDHTGGLADLLDAHAAATVYVLPSFSNKLGDAARRAGADVITVAAPTEICPGAWSLGDLSGGGKIAEQSLLIETGGGAIVVTGCAHPGIVGIVERAVAKVGGDVVAALGGFHLFETDEDVVRGIAMRLEELGVRFVGPCHCTGERSAQLFSEVFGDGFVSCHAGAVIEPADLVAGRTG